MLEESKIETTETQEIQEVHNKTTAKTKTKTSKAVSLSSPPQTPPLSSFKTKSTNFGVSRNQFVYMTHYHKTGDNVSYRYLKAVGSMSASSMIDVVYYPNDMKRIVGFFERRNTTNGCANLDIAKLLKNRPGPKIHFLHFNSPNLFCDINHHDVFSQKFFFHLDGNGTANANGIQYQPDVKIIHLIRDPFDMVVSNYLYHSQTPTPEPFVKTYDPCKFGKAYLKLIIDASENNETTTLITQQQVDGLKDLCENLMLNKNTNKKYRGFYDALLGLSVQDGLRLSAIVLLVSKAHYAGGDLLRMTTNVERLHQWQTKQQQQHQEHYTATESTSSSRSGIISLKTHPDWDKENYEVSLDRLTEFIVSDLEVKRKPNNNTTSNDDDERTLQQYKEALLQAVRNDALERLNDNMAKKANHITRHRMTPEEREDAVAKLKADDLLGPILSACQTIIDSADGQLKH